MLRYGDWSFRLRFFFSKAEDGIRVLVVSRGLGVGKKRRVSLSLVSRPLLYPLMLPFKWDPVWLGVLLTINIAIGQFTPPMAVNLMVACRLANVRIEETVPWVGWLLVSFVVAALLVLFFPELALWLPRSMGY